MTTSSDLGRFLDRYVREELLNKAKHPVQKAEPLTGGPRKKKKPRELVDLHVEEISAVDHPAQQADVAHREARAGGPGRGDR